MSLKMEIISDLLLCICLTFWQFICIANFLFNLSHIWVQLKDISILRVFFPKIIVIDP